MSRNGNRVRQIDIELGCPETNIDPASVTFRVSFYETISSWNSIIIVTYEKEVVRITM